MEGRWSRGLCRVHFACDGQVRIVGVGVVVDTVCGTEGVVVGTVEEEGGVIATVCAGGVCG